MSGVEIVLIVVIFILIGLVVLFIRGDIVSSEGLRKTFKEEHENDKTDTESQ